MAAIRVSEYSIMHAWILIKSVLIIISPPDNVQHDLRHMARVQNAKKREISEGNRIRIDADESSHIIIQGAPQRSV